MSASPRPLPNPRPNPVKARRSILAARGERFDLIFVDGDHGAEAVFRNLMLVADLLRGERSLLVAHDYAAADEPQRQPWTLGVQQGVDRFLAARPFTASRHAGLLVSLRRPRVRAV